MRGEGSVHSGACEGAVCGSAARGSAGFNAVYEEEMVEPLDSMRVELCKDARRVESCFGDEFVRWVCADGKEGGETCDGG
jgi:hypothetical protein